MRRRYIVLFLAAWAWGQNTNIKVNQLGYPTWGKKVAVVANAGPGKSFQVINGSGTAVYSGTMSANGYPVNNVTYYLADFSAVTAPGTYRVSVDNNPSYSFEIKNDVYTAAARHAMRMFYYQRSHQAISEPFAAGKSREAGVPNGGPNYAILAKGGANSGSMPATGGWYDAGDYGRYVPTAAVTAGILLTLHQAFPGAFADGSLNIPESSNGRPDILDEVKYELDWLMQMQHSSGYAYHKIAPKTFLGLNHKPEADNPHVVFGPSTSSTFAYAAILAKASRMYKTIDATFAANALTRAKNAWAWAIANPSVVFKNSDYGVASETSGGSGEYSESNPHNDKIWAAVELMLATGEQVYRDSVYRGITLLRADLYARWDEPSCLGVYALLFDPAAAAYPDLQEQMRIKVLETAETRLNTALTNGFGMSGVPTGWGSNAYVATVGFDFMIAWRLTGNPRYLAGAQSQLDFLFGKNPVNYSFVTGLGANAVKNPHHRITQAYYGGSPVPGIMVSGMKSDYTFQDNSGNYETCEPAINYNAPLVALLAAMDQAINHLATYFPGPYTLTIYAKKGSVTVSPAKATYAAGDQVTLTAVPAAGAVFEGWKGFVSGTQTNATLGIYANSRVLAMFRETAEYIRDPYFYNPATNWIAEYTSPSPAPVAVADFLSYTFRIPAADVADSSKYRLRGGRIILEYGYQYTLTLTARANANKKVYVGLYKQVATQLPPYQGGLAAFTLTPTMAEYKQTFSMKYQTDSAAIIRVLLGSDSSDVEFQGISLIRGAQDPELVGKTPLDITQASPVRELIANNAGLRIAASGGLIELQSAAAVRAEIFSATGQRIREIKLNPGETCSVAVSSGLYVLRYRVNGQWFAETIAVRR